MCTGTVRLKLSIGSSIGSVSDMMYHVDRDRQIGIVQQHIVDAGDIAARIAAARPSGRRDGRSADWRFRLRIDPRRKRWTPYAASPRTASPADARSASSPWRDWPLVAAGSPDKMAIPASQRTRRRPPPCRGIAPNPCTTRNQRKSAALLRTTRAGRVDVLHPVLRAHRAVDVSRQWLGAGIRPVPSAHPDLEHEAIGGSVDQLDARDETCACASPRTPSIRVIVADPHAHAVREARQLGIFECVLMHAGHQAVDRAAADLKDGVEIAGQWIWHDRCLPAIG